MTEDVPGPLLMRQKSLFHGFRFEFATASGDVIGELDFAWFAQPKNARLKFHEEGSTDGDIQLRLQGEPYRIRFEYLRRGGWTQDLRYTLETVGAQVLATVDVLSTTDQRLPRIVLRAPLVGEIGTARTWFRKRYDISNAASGERLGHVCEPRAVSWRRELEIDVPGATPALKALLGLVVLCVRY